MLSFLQSLPLVLYVFFFSGLLCHVAPNLSMFTRRYARSHRLAGLAYMAWLLAGLTALGWSALMSGQQEAPKASMIDALEPDDETSRHQQDWPMPICLLYDIVLGLLGIILTLTAASEFSGHKKVVNPASGALDKEATVTVDEMLEHVFYQGLNLVQIMYLHSAQYTSKNPTARAVALLLVTLPWAARGRFPVNSFSANYTDKPANIVRVLYRLKKYQYLIYKHWLLHGLNISIAITGEAIASRIFFRLYWLSLNAAYVFEFFLQTLVKKGHMMQGMMLGLNQLLMIITSIPVLSVISYAQIPASLASLILNLANRGHELTNVALSSIIGACATMALSTVLH